MNDKLNDKLLKLNTPGQVIEVTQEEAERLGAFVENALTEEEALASAYYEESQEK